MRHLLCFPALALVLTAAAGRAAPPAAVDRGDLSLAWDAHESGLYREALDYLVGIEPRSPVHGEALWLRAECLYALGRYAEAAAVLVSKEAELLEGRAEFLRDVYWEWAWEATGRERYGEAERVIRQGLDAVGGKGPHLEALGEATRFRAGVAAWLERGGGALPGGEEIVLGVPDASPPGSDWVRVVPWSEREGWVPLISAEQWMPGLATRLEQEGRGLWMRVSPASLATGVRQEALDRGLRVRWVGGGMVLAPEDGGVFLDLEEWAFRAAVEGLGVRGAVATALARSGDRLTARVDLLRWVTREKGHLEVDPSQWVISLRSPRTGRAFGLDPDGWSEAFYHHPGEWAEVWRELVAELDREPRPFRCFCGREVFLREILVSDSGPVAVLERGPGYAVGLLALCPRHQQLVSPDLLAEWGVSSARAWEKARADATERPWEVTFHRGEVEGSPYLILEGEGVAALARRPDLLLGAMEAVEGVGARGRALRVVAPSASSLVVSGEEVPEARIQEASRRALRWAGRYDGWVDRLGYGIRVKLPSRGSGRFRVVPSDS